MIRKREAILILVFLGITLFTGPMSAGQSVLREGSWTRVGITKSGVYRLTWSDLTGMGISNPSEVSVYANNQGQLSFYNDGTATDDLSRVPVVFQKGSDNVFGEGDYIIFYAEGTHRWNYDKAAGRYSFSRHHYSDTAYYFITSKAGDALVMQQYATPSDPPVNTSQATDVCYRYENETVSILGSGREWYQPAPDGVSKAITPGFSNIITTEKIYYRTRVLGRSGSQVSFSLRQGTQTVGTIIPPVINMSDQNGLYASVAYSEGSFMPQSASPSFSITFSNGGNSSALGWIDYVDLTGRAASKYTGGQLLLSDSRAAGAGMITRFVVTSPVAATVWDITNPAVPMTVNASFANGELSFTALTETLRRYVIFTASDLMTPVILHDRVANQDLHSQAATDMIIVTHPLFLRQAERLATMHLNNDGLTSAIVTPQQVYNEFSGGIPDAVAIRNYVRFIYEKYKSTPLQLRYLLLFGDGSYENRTRPPANPAYIPTWQSVNSNTGVMSFTSDDFYGLLDPGEGEADGYLDIGIGRIPVADTVNAGAVVDKINRYMSSASFGSWRNTLCLVADDEDNNLHMTDAENLSVIVASEAPAVTTDKIYLDAFKQVSSISGNTYPDATSAINNRMDNGCLMLNYVGHGSETGLAHEKVIRTDDINSWDNSTMLPLVITATCEFSRFDNVTINSATGAITPSTSAGEMILLNHDGGGIALMSTTRVVYSAPNYTLNSNILRYAFDTAADGAPMRLGDIIRLAKINSGSGTNKRNFSLLGDPALRLAWPKNGTVVTDSINHVSVEAATDTLKALSRITISGHIQWSSGMPDGSFNGMIEPVVFDKPSTITTLGNDGGETISFPVAGSILFKGVTTVINGRFSFSFIVPMDINYSYGAGRITYYAYNDNTDVNGYFDGITVGGFSGGTISDNTGPAIQLFMNDTLFSDGDITDNNPVLLARLTDESGINVSGTGIGHDIVAWVDDDMSESFVLNQVYKSDPAAISSGSVTWPLAISEAGPHTITLRAWDNLNNYSQATLAFIVREGGSFALTDVLCYPNPAIEDVSFSFTHNRPDDNITLTLKIFNASGEIIRVMKESAATAGYKFPVMIWDGCTQTGRRAAKGVYIWKAEAENASGEYTSASGRIVIL